MSNKEVVSAWLWFVFLFFFFGQSSRLVAALSFKNTACCRWYLKMHRLGEYLIILLPISAHVGQKIAFIEKDCVLFKGRLRQLSCELRMFAGPSWRVEIITLAR